MTQETKAVFALLGTVILWSLMVVITRIAVTEVHPFTLLFLRLAIASVFFAPFVWRKKPWKNKKFSYLIKISPLLMTNVTFFILGIQYTTASASQLIYAIMPILVLIASALFLRQKYHWGKNVGVVVGLMGVVALVFLSAEGKGTTIAGSLSGNLLIVIAMLGWVSYIILSKNISRVFSAVEISGVAIIISLLLSIPLVTAEIIYYHGTILMPQNGLLAAFYLGFCGTFLTYILQQYAIKRLSTLTVSLTSYIQPITTAAFEIMLLDEKMTTGFLVGGGLVFLGLFLSTTIEVLHHRMKRVEVFVE
ncbi:MAG: DMT family transporter [Patescibacteria group bacterium]|nr:DMT family transporter [Patescibacteria group bacterium]